MANPPDIKRARIGRHNTEHGRSRRSFTSRATRYQLTLPIRYRSIAEQTWHEGEVQNISGSGILFRCREPLEIAANIELVFSLPAGDPEHAAAGVTCKAEIVRVVPPDAAGGHPAIAAAIKRFRLKIAGTTP